MKTILNLNINSLRGSDASAPRNVFRHEKVAATRFSLSPNQNKGREKWSREMQIPNNQIHISYRYEM